MTVLALCALLDPRVSLAGELRLESLGSAWDDGRAEVAAYRSEETIYGEPRTGEEFLITVTEEQDRESLVKAAPGAAPSSFRSVVKLNRERTVSTGIYTYRQMSSVFLDRGTLELTKIAMSSQEWCGTSFAEALVRDGQLRVRAFSYFSGEADREFELEWPKGSWAADALPLLVRSLPSGEGGTARLALLPSLLGNRIQVPRLVDATVSWTEPEKRGTGRVQTVTVAAEGWGTETLLLEANGERRILEWTRRDGGRSRLVSSERLTYWRMNQPGREGTREALLEGAR